MFTAQGLFKSIPCPSKETCRVPNCIFSHDLPASSKQQAANPAAHTQPTQAAFTDSPCSSPNAKYQDHSEPRKRQKLESRRGQPAATVALAPCPSSPRRPGSLSTSRSATAVSTTSPDHTSKQSQTTSFNIPRSVTRKVSPPKASTNLANPKLPTKSSHGQFEKTQKESLNPRMLQKAPAPHATRKLLLDKLHEQIVRLDDRVRKSTSAEVKGVQYDEQQLIRLALDEEQRIAENEPTVYKNVIKLRITALKKMSVETWVEQRKAEMSRNDPQPEKPRPPPPVKTGLTPQEEVKALARLIASPTGLDQHGYVTTVPSQNDVELARKGVESAAGYEQCDRCDTRFQVFPERREDGALTTGGQCRHHWGRARRAPRPKGSKLPAETEWTCCKSPMGTEPCSVAPTHVFKVSEAKRLALVTPFIQTPFNASVRTDRAICFDCEMGYTVYGTELIRLTAVSWPSGEPALDILVRPRGAVLDLNTRFSGVTAERFSTAPEYDTASPPPLDDPSNLVIVSSPEVARSLLCDLISADTPLLGHALENDLNAVRLVHPCMVDSILLFPHPQGLPLRFGLKNLAERYLKWQIQIGGDKGHDSLEDARATGELIRYKVKTEWEKMKCQGWTLVDGAFVEPPMKSKAKSVTGEDLGGVVEDTSAIEGESDVLLGLTRKRKASE